MSSHGDWPQHEALLIDMNPADLTCAVCGGPASTSYGVPMLEGLLVSNDWVGEWGGQPACQKCYEKHARGELRTHDHALAGTLGKPKRIQVKRDGVTRTVFLVGRWAIKVPSLRYSWRLFLRGLLANMNERDIWSWSGVPDWGGTPRKCLARVIWCMPGGWMLVMERAIRTLKDGEFEMADIPEIRRTIRDCKADNIGVFVDGLRAVDYGEGWTAVEEEHEKNGTLGGP